jgi:hypothetical protein
MTTVAKFTTPSAAGAEVHTRAERHMSTKGGTYQEAVRAVLMDDKQLAEAYAQPEPAEKRSQPAIPVTGGDEREIREWLLRALKDNMVGSLPGALGTLTIEADKFKKIGMPIEEAARRAMDENPHLMTMANLLLADVRRNAPENTPAPADKAAAGLAQGKPVERRHSLPSTPAWATTRRWVQCSPPIRASRLATRGCSDEPPIRCGRRRGA